MTGAGLRLSDWLMIPRPRRGAGVRVVCLPHGGTAAFWPWAERLPPEIELAIVQLPGRESRLREPPYRQMTDLVDDAVEALGEALADPFVLFGHSVGALLAFELAMALEAGGLAPAGLIVAGQNSPPRGSSGSGAIGQSVPGEDELTDEALLSQLKELGGTPQSVLDDPDLVDLLLPAFRADADLIRTYRPTDDRRISCPVTAYGGLEDELTSRSGLRRWQERTDAECRLRMFPGAHFFIETAEELVLQALSADAFAVSR